MSKLSDGEKQKIIDQITDLEEQKKELNKLRGSQYELDSVNNGYGNINSEIERLENEIEEMQNKLDGKSWLRWVRRPFSSGGRRYKKKRSTKRKKSAKRRTRRS
jgi:flagellar biosynthesis chaperone FliJ